MGMITTPCNQCGFCKWHQQNDTQRIQIGCEVGRIEAYEGLRQRIDPNGHKLDNKVLKFTEAGDEKYYVINQHCLYQRSQKWIDENLTNIPKDQIKQFVYDTIPFLYGAIVISDGNTKHTMKACKSVLVSSLQSEFLTIVYPYKFINDKGKEELVLALRDRIGKDLPKQHEDFRFDVRQIVLQESDNTRTYVTDALYAKKHYFWILILTANTKIDAGFIASIKHQVVENFLDFHVISLDNENMLTVQPVLTGDADFAASACYRYKNNALVQEYSVDYIKNYFNIVE